MSGTPPYVLLAVGDDIVALGANALQYVYSGDAAVFDGGYDFFDTACIAVVNAYGENDHPSGTYDVRYPYCRTALQYNMSDVRADPQIGQLIPQAPYLSIQLRLVGCDLSQPISVDVEVQPPQTNGCAIAVFPGYEPTDFLIILDSTTAILPLRMYLTVTNGAGRTKLFWIGVRSTRNSPASGSVVPARGGGA